MSQKNESLEDIKTKVNNHLEKQQKILIQEHIKTKEFFEDLKQDSITNFEEVKENLQKHIQTTNSLTKNLQTHFQTQPFDFSAFSKVIFEYQAKQLEILSESTKSQTKKITDFQNKLVSYYNENQNRLKQEIKDSEKK